LSIWYYGIIKCPLFGVDGITFITLKVTDAQGIFAPEAGEPGIITVTATAKGLAPAKTILKTN
jgi:hypothetical protein